MRRWRTFAGRDVATIVEILTLITQQLRSKLVDATHIETGKVVYIKEVKTDDDEHRIAQLLAQEDWVNDPRNHCVPIVKIFRDHIDPGVSYIVMPFLRPADNPPFELVKDVIDFVDQILEVHPDFLIARGSSDRDIRVWPSSMRKA